VLVVDDDPECRRILHAVLEYGGAVVSTTGSVRDALGVMERVRADVILAAVALSAQDGHWLVQHLRPWPADRRGRVPVVAMTAADDGRGKILAAGISERVRTPVAVDVMDGILRRVSAGTRAR
jgi:CheY-like chemotaxis protein